MRISMGFNIMSKFIYFASPMALLISPYVFFAFFEGAPFYFAKESGAVENITVVVLVLALSLTISIFFQYRKKTKSPILASNTTVLFRDFTLSWLVVYALGCIYFLGEEISWGQHLFDWSTPEAWLVVNNQHETNLHNTSALFDQVPRFLMSLAIVIGGLFYPLFTRNKGVTADISSKYTFIMPSLNCAISAGTVLFISIHDKIYSMFNIDMPAFLQINDGEVKESLIAMFILVYIFDFYQRLKHNKYV